MLALLEYIRMNTVKWVVQVKKMSPGERLWTSDIIINDTINWQLSYSMMTLARKQLRISNSSNGVLNYLTVPSSYKWNF